MTHDADDRIERLIDRAASSLTDVGTSPAFTTRVMATLDAPAVRPRSWWGPVPAFAAACALLIAVFVGLWQFPGTPGDEPVEAHILPSRALPTMAVLVPAVSGLAAPSRAPVATRIPVTHPAEFPRVHTYDPIDIVDLAIALLPAESAPLVEPLLAPDPIQLDPVAIDAIDAIEHSPSPRSDPPQSPGGRR